MAISQLSTTGWVPGGPTLEISVLFVWKLKFRVGERQANTKPGPGARLSFLVLRFPLTLTLIASQGGGGGGYKSPSL